MRELLTTEEAADHLRLSERKLYELVAGGAVPCSKVTGRWLFPKAALDRWVASGLVTGIASVASAPPIVGGSHDSLLEWALRESGCGLANLAEGSEAGLRRLARGEVAAAAIHLHRLDGDNERANIDAVAGMPGLHDAVLVAFAKREQGLLVAPGNPLALDSIEAAAGKRARMALRPDGAGAQLLLLAMLDRAQLKPDMLNAVNPAFATGVDMAHAIRTGRADCGIATRSVARASGLDFVPLTWERFDLAVCERDYFKPTFQALSDFLRGPAFRSHSEELGGYDIEETNRIRFAH